MTKRGNETRSRGRRKRRRRGGIRRKGRGEGKYRGVVKEGWAQIRRLGGRVTR